MSPVVQYPIINEKCTSLPSSCKHVGTRVQKYHEILRAENERFSSRCNFPWYVWKIRLSLCHEETTRVLLKAFGRCENSQRPIIVLHEIK